MALPTSAQLTSASTTNADQKTYLAGLRDFLSALNFGQCRLTKSGSNLLLSRFNGKQLLIADDLQTIPSAGVTLAPTGLTAGTLYYIYAYMNSSTMTLEASTTGHSTDSTTGMEIKTGDRTRTLVGMARTTSGTAWADTAAQRFVCSWFNRQKITTLNYFTAARTCTSLTTVEVNSEIRNEFICFAQESEFNYVGSVSQSSAGNRLTSYITLDGTTALENTMELIPDGTGAYPVSLHAPATLTEGYHYATVSAQVSAGTGTFRCASGATTGFRPVLSGVIFG